MSDPKAPIGVFDSGVGGLSVLRELLRLMPDESYIYLGDSARVPYGSKSPETVQLFARQCARYLRDRGVKLIVVACNSASAVGLDAVRNEVDVPVVGVIDPAAAAAVATSRRAIGVIGTRATVGSGAYEQAIARHAQIPVHALACPLFVPLVEEDWATHQAAELIARSYLEALPNVDSLILGCTHYPLLKPLLARLLPDTHLIDCGEHAARMAQELLHPPFRSNGDHEPVGKRVEFCLTDVPPTFVTIAERFLGFRVGAVDRVQIDHLCLGTPTPH